MTLSEELRGRCERVRLLALDVDGVLTDGRLSYAESGEAIKTFHVRDGLGLRLVREAGIEVAVISARGSAALDARLRDLKIVHAYTGRDDKLGALAELLERTGRAPAECAYVGDDVIDLPILRRVGLAVTVADGHPLVRREAHLVTAAAGGAGAVREVCDLLLDVQGGLTARVESFLALHQRAQVTP